MSESNVKTYLPGKNYKFLFLASSIFCLLILYLLVPFRTENRTLTENFLAVLLISGSIGHIWLFIYDIKRKIIVSSEEIKNIKLPLLNNLLNPGYSRRTICNINWKEIKSLKYREEKFHKFYPINKFQQFYLVNKEKKFLSFTLPHIKEGEELISYIENKTGLKFEEIKSFKEV